MSKLRIFLLLLTCGSSVHAGPTLQIKNQLQTLSGVPENRSIGSGFMIENGLVVTASHVISPIYPSLPKGTMTVNNVPLTLVCYDNIMDVALLRPDASIPGAQFLQLHNNVKIGMEYIAVYDNNDGIIMPIPHSVGQLLEMPLSLLAKGIVLDIVRANVRNIDNSVNQIGRAHV